VRVSEALNAVSRIYVPGVAKYYDALKPDPWFAAHEELEKVMLEGDQAAIESAADRFVARMTELVERFKREGAPSKGVSAADGLFMGDDKRVRGWQSRKAKECVQCGTKEKLKLMSNPKDKVDVVVICHDCAAEVERRGA
jgi:hypothetical protein